MARNRSEKPTAHPKVHAYADACRDVLYKNAPTRLASGAWHKLSSNTQTRLDRHATPGTPNWRQRRIDYMREHYGA